MILSKLPNLFCIRNVIKPTNNCRFLFNRKTRNLNKPNITLSTNRKKSFFLWFTKRSGEELKQTDNIPPEYTLIYRNTMTKYIYLSQIIVFFTTSALCLVYISTDSRRDINQKSEVDSIASWTKNATRTENELMYYLTAFVLLLVLVQSVIGQLPVRIYRIPTERKYLFVFHRKVPIGLGMRTETCQAGDLKRVDHSSSILPWKYNTYLMKNSKSVILYDHYFRRPADFNILLGEEKEE